MVATIRVEVSAFYVWQRKTKWDGRNQIRKSIRSNTDSAKNAGRHRARRVVREGASLAPSHNHRFVVLLDELQPNWAFYQRELNRLLVRQKRWSESHPA